MSARADDAIRWTWCDFDALGVHGLYEVMALRQEVFVVEQECPYLDADGSDPIAMHLLGRDADHRLVAYCRAYAPGVVYRESAIGRVVTSPLIRGTGMGRPLMREAIAGVDAMWPGVPIKLSAQAHLEAYYASLGFRVCGPGYLEDGIPHLPMKRHG